MKPTDLLLIIFAYFLVMFTLIVNYERLARIESKLDRIIDFENLNEITAE